MYKFQVKLLGDSDYDYDITGIMKNSVDPDHVASEEAS